MIRPFTIALLYGGERSEKYAQIMKDIINEKTKYYPFMPVLINSEFLQNNKNDHITNTIFNTLDSCEYVFAFFTKFYEGKEAFSDESKKVFLCKPNLILEYGYLLKQLEVDKLIGIIDFSHRNLKEEFIFPSDLPGLVLESIPAQEEGDDLVRDALVKLFDAKIGVLNLKQYTYIEADELIFPCKKYSVDFGEIFSREMRDSKHKFSINKYSLEEQYNCIWDTWEGELKEIERADIPEELRFNYKVMFCYERLLFVLIFKDIVDNFDALKLIENLDFNPTKEQSAIVNAYDIIYHYITNMDGSKSSFFEKKVVSLKKQIEKFPQPLNPLILAIVENYLGLSYLNWYKNLKSEKKQQAVLLLEKAEECFIKVIEICDCDGSLNDIANLLPAYAYYNLARVRSMLDDAEELWEDDYLQAIKEREKLAKYSKFPEFIRLYFEREVYHAQIVRIFSKLPLWKEANDVQEIKEAQEEMQEILDELRKYEKLCIRDEDFFKTIKANANKNVIELTEILD